MKPLLPHIEIGHEKGRVVLEVFDVELSDFIEDYLTENYEFMPEGIKSRNESVVLSFGANISMEKVKEALMKLSSSEIESIYKVNHSC